MARPIQRHLNLSDLAILIAATAIGVWLLKAAHDSRNLNSVVVGGPTIWSWKIGREVAPFLLTTSAGLLAARSLRPRPRDRVLYRQPGLVACLAILVGTAVSGAFLVGHSRIANLRGYGLNYPIDSYLAVVMGSGELIAVSWAALALAGVWRPEPSWVDRAGRLLGALAIILWVSSRLSL